MSASEMQQQRTKQYFLDSAKEILRGEGLKVASARNIAERAGYSYTALYNYFKDMNALIFACVQDFQEEIVTAVKLAQEGKTSPKELIFTGVKGWINYFIQYPGIFELFFLEGIGEGTEGETSEAIYNSIVPACSDGIKALMIEGKIDQLGAEELQNTIRNTMTGLLLYYSNRKHPSDYGALLTVVDRQLNFLL